MRKLIFSLLTVMMSMGANAQTDIDFAEIFGSNGAPLDSVVKLNQGIAKVSNGVAFIADTRSADRIKDGHYTGMKVEAFKKYFKSGKGLRQYTACVNFCGAASGFVRKHVADSSAVPSSRMIQMKPTSDGKLEIMACAKKNGANIYIGVHNGSSYKNLAVLTVPNTGQDGTKIKAGSKKNAFNVLQADYKYTAGDELWLYSNAAACIYGINFTGNIDKSYVGTLSMGKAKPAKKNKNKNRTKEKEKTNTDNDNENEE